MAIYKLFPYKDATLYSFFPEMNTGIDPITDISNLNIAVATNPQVARFLTEFVQSEIEDVINNKINGAQWDVDFRSFIATAQGIVESTDLSVHPLAQYWYNGSGEYLNIPIPVYVTMMYTVVLRAEYQQQMNEVVQPFMTTGGGINYDTISENGYKYEIFIGDAFAQEDNVANMEEDERKYQTSIEIKALGLLIGDGPNDETPKATKTYGRSI